MEKITEFFNKAAEWFSSGEGFDFIVTNIKTILLYLVGIIVTVAFSKIIDKCLELANKKIKNDKIKRLITKAKEIIHTVTDVTTQTFVSGLKKTGAFTTEKQEEAFEKSLNEAKELINRETKNAIEKEYIDIDTFIGHEIEAHLHQDKKTTPTVEVVSTPAETQPVASEGWHNVK